MRALLPAFLPFLATLVATLPVAARAQPAPEAARIPYPSVAAALKDLESRDGSGTVVTHPDGWTVVNEPPITQWSFTPAGHAAHPAVVRRIIRRGAGGKVTVETASLCEAAQDACAGLLAEFARLNERIVQQAQARGGPRPLAPPE